MRSPILHRIAGRCTRARASTRFGVRTTMLNIWIGLAGVTPLLAEPAKVDSAELAARIERLEAIHDIQNVLGYYEEYQSALEFDRVWPLFALDQPDVRWEVGPGAYVGGDAVKGALMAQEKRPNDTAWFAIQRWELHVHTLATPIIVIAGDGQTAKSTFDSPGLETLSGATHKPDARLGWCKYGIDLIKTPQGWKIWHMHVYGVIFSPATKSWVDAPGFPPRPKSTDVGGEWPAFTRPQSD